MANGFRIEGKTSGRIPEVDINDNLHVNLPTSKALAGFVCIGSEADDGSVTGTREIHKVSVSENGRLKIGADEPLMFEAFPGAALNSALWTAPVTTATVTVSGGLLTLNAAASVASGAVARVSSYRYFPTPSGGALLFECTAQLVQNPQANNVTEWGVGIATATTAPTDGAFFRLNAAGEFRAVINFNSTELQSPSLDFATLVGTNTARRFAITIYDDICYFSIDDVVVARIEIGVGGAQVTASAQLPVLFRTYNTAVTSAAQVLKVGNVFLGIGGLKVDKPHAAKCAGMGGMCSQGQTGGTMGTTASYANSADPAASAALSNTATLVTGLGGQFRFNAAATGVTDGIVTSYQNPAGTAALPGRTLHITGIKISCANLGVPVATTATTLAWSLAYGHTAVSLATAEAATTKAPRRVPLGIQNWPVGAAVGASPDRGDLYMPFNSPIAVQPGEFIAAVAKFIVGTATASQVIWGHVTFDGYFE